jgi:hypothetical protein
MHYDFSNEVGARIFRHIVRQIVEQRRQGTRDKGQGTRDKEQGSGDPVFDSEQRRLKFERWLGNPHDTLSRSAPGRYARNRHVACVRRWAIPDRATIAGDGRALSDR